MGYPLELTYIATMHKNRKYGVTWTMYVFISVTDAEFGTRRIVALHHEAIPRTTMQARISEATRRSLYVLCCTHKEAMVYSEFRHIPRRACGGANTLVPPPLERNLVLDIMLELLIALSIDVDAMGCGLVYNLR